MGWEVEVVRGAAAARQQAGGPHRTHRWPQRVTKQHVRDSPAELLVGQHEALQPDWELHIAAPHHVLNLEVQELGWEAQLLHHSGVLPGC